MHGLLFKKFGNGNKDEFEYIFHMMYSVYSMPNIALPLIGGVLICKFGHRTMFLLFGSCVLVGQFIFAFGCTTNSIYTMLIGRIVFGLGGESLNTAQYSLIIEWFSVNEMAFAIGVCLSIARFGNVLNDIVSPRIATVNKYLN